MMHRYLAIVALASLSACATVVNGSTDVVAVTSSPAGASCSIARNGEPLVAVASTPAVVSVSKSGSSLDVTCTKPGYHNGIASTSSQFNGYTFGNFLIGGLVGFAVDGLTGANYDYPLVIDVVMAPDLGAIPQRPSASVDPSTASMQITRVMALPDGAAAKRSFLLRACNAGDATACILVRGAPREYTRAASRS